MPAHLRRYARDFRLENWVDTHCVPIEDYFVTIDELINRLNTSHRGDSEPTDQILQTAVSAVLDHEGILEDYIVDSDVTGYSFTEEGFMVPFLAAASAIVVRRYRTACEKKSWPPTADEGS